ncbi:phospholipase A2 activating protein, putative, partial [Eimeria maxima]
AHEDIIRCIAALPPSSSSSSSNSTNSSNRFVSVSNDRRIKLWGGDGQCLTTKEDAHEAFIFTCRPGYLYTAGDDGLCCLWQLPESADAAAPSISSLQQLQHPATVWQVLELPTGDVATACEDGALRVWTADEARALPADVIAAAKAEAEAVSPHAVQQLQQPSQQQQEQYKEQQYVKEQEDRNGSLVLCLVAIHNAKTRAEAPATAGATETQAVAAAAAIAAIAAFCIVCCRQRARTRKKEERRWICKSCQLKQSLRLPENSSSIRSCSNSSVRGDEAVVFVWQQQQQKWEFVGMALNPIKNTRERTKQKTYFPGDQFFAAGEYDFVFDVEIGDEGTYKKLPFNRGENPLVVSEKFAAREGLHKTYLPQIVSFINTNTGGAGGAVSSASAGGTAATAACSSSRSNSTDRLQKHIPVLQCVSFLKANIGGLQKGLLEAQQTLKEQEDQAQLSTLDESYLSAALDKLRSDNFLKETFRASEVHVMMQQLSLFPAAQQLPVFDLWRLLCLHPQYSLACKNTTNNGWDFVLLALQRIKETCATAAEQQQQQQQVQGAACCRMGLLQAAAPAAAVVCFAMDAAAESTAAVAAPLAAAASAELPLLELMLELMASETDPQLFYHTVVGVGTLLSDSVTLQQLQQQLQQLQQLLPPLNERVQPDLPLGEATQELLNMIS